MEWLVKEIDNYLRNLISSEIGDFRVLLGFLLNSTKHFPIGFEQIRK